MNSSERESIRMGVVVVVVVIDGGGRVIGVLVTVVGGGIGVVEGIRRREAEKSPEAESEATQLLQWEAADEIQQLLAAQPLWHARYELPCVGGHVRHREHHRAVEHHLAVSVSPVSLALCAWTQEKLCFSDSVPVLLIEVWFGLFV
jgi:hypothetical protein